MKTVQITKVLKSMCSLDVSTFAFSTILVDWLADKIIHPVTKS